MSARAVRARPAARRRAGWWLAVCLCAAAAAAGYAADGTPPATPEPTATAALPVPLPEIAKRSEDVAVYLKQLEERLAPGPEIETIDTELPQIADRIRVLRVRTTSAIAASPALGEVDELMNQWQGYQDTLSGWSAALTDGATILEQEMRGLGELLAIWRATRDAAQAAGAPPAVLDRIKATRSLIQDARKRVESYRATLLVLQDRVVQLATGCREAADDLATYRRSAVGRLLVRDSQPIWAPARWTADWSQALPSRDELTDAAQVAREYIRLQLPRVPLQLALFVVLLLLWRRARQRTARWLAEDDSLASIAAVFKHPVSSALFITLLSTAWLYPQLPLALRQIVRIAAAVPLLRVVDRLVDRPILPGLFTLGAFFIVDQIRSLLAPLPLVDQLLFLLEMLTGVVVLTWMLRSGRIRRLSADLSPRVVALLERAARVLVALFAFALLAGALGFMELARVVAGVVLGSGYAAILFFAVQRLAQGLWAFLLRTRALRRFRLVRHYRALLEQRGERLLRAIATVLWVAATLRSAGLFAAGVRPQVRAIVTASLRVGWFSISLGDVVAFAVTVWLSFAVLALRALRARGGSLPARCTWRAACRMRSRPSCTTSCWWSAS